MATVSVSPSNSIGTTRYIWAIGAVTIASTSFGDVDVGERDGMQRQLLGQRLGQLIVVDQAHVDGDFAQQLARVLMLLIHQQLLLLIGDEPHVNQDLSDASMSHRWRSQEWGVELGVGDGLKT